MLLRTSWAVSDRTWKPCCAPQTKSEDSRGYERENSLFQVVSRNFLEGRCRADRAQEHGLDLDPEKGARRQRPLCSLRGLVLKQKRARTLLSSLAQRRNPWTGSSLAVLNLMALARQRRMKTPKSTAMDSRKIMRREAVINRQKPNRNLLIKCLYRSAPRRSRQRPSPSPRGQFLCRKLRRRNLPSPSPSRSRRRAARMPGLILSRMMICTARDASERLLSRAQRQAGRTTRVDKRR